MHEEFARYGDGSGCTIQDMAWLLKQNIDTDVEISEEKEEKLAGF